MSNLNLNTVELVSTLRAAPENGSPSSQDYNDSWTESLADLASLAGFINQIIIPMFDGLVPAILPNPQGSPYGLEGRFIYADTTDITDQVFYDSLTNQSLDIASSIRVLEGILATALTTINTLQSEVINLQSQLSSTNQNDISQALQNIYAALSNLTNLTVSNTTQINNNVVLFETNGVENTVQTLLNLVAGENVTLVQSNGTITIASTGGGGGSTSPGGTNGQIQYNNSGVFGGLTLIPIANGGTGSASPALVAGANIGLTGTWPNNTITFLPAGSSTNIQINASGSLYADGNFTYNHSTQVVGLTGTLTFNGSSSGSASIGVATSAGSPNILVLPTTTGTSGQLLSTNGGSPQQLSWVNSTGATLQTNGVANSSQTLLNLAAGSNITLSNVGGTVTITSTGGGGSTTPGGTSGQIQYNNSGVFGGLSTTGTGSVVLNDEPTFVSYITLDGSSSGSASIGVAAAAGSPNELVLPTTTGTSGQVLTTNGSNPQQLSWTSTGNITGTITSGQVAYGSGSNAITGSGNLTWNNSTSALVLTNSGSSAGTLYVGALDSAFSYTPNTYGVGQQYILNRIGVVNQGTSTTNWGAFAVLNQDNLSGGNSQALVGARFDVWSNNSTTINVNASYPSNIIGGIFQALHFGSGNLTGTGGGPVGLLTNAGVVSATTVSTLTSLVADISTVSGSTIGTITGIWIPNLGSSGATVTLARGLYMAPITSGPATLWGLYIDGNTPNYFGGPLTFGGSASGSAVIGVAAAAGTPNPLHLPITTGTSGQVLTTNGANPQQLSWTTPSTITLETNGVANASQSILNLAAGSNITLTNAGGIVTISGTGGGGATTPGGTSGQIQYNNAGAFGGLPTTGSGGTVVLNTSPTFINEITFSGTISGSASLGVATTAGTPNTILLPTTTGSAGQALVTDGNSPQQSSWATVGNLTGTLTAGQIPYAITSTTLGASGLSWSSSTNELTLLTTGSVAGTFEGFNINTQVLGTTSGYIIGINSILQPVLAGPANEDYIFQAISNSVILRSLTATVIGQAIGNGTDIEALQNTTITEAVGFYAFLNEANEGGAITASIGFGSVIQSEGSTFNATYFAGNGISGLTGNYTFYSASGVNYFGGTQGTIFGGNITFNGSTSGSAAIGVAAIAGTPTALILPTTTGTSGQVLSTNGGTPQQLSWATISGTGSVTSVGMTGDGVIYNSVVTNSPITASGNLIPVLLTQTANHIFGGPVSGLAATPTFRALVLADLPAIAASNLTNGTTGTGSIVLAVAPALTGIPTAPTAASSTNTTQIATTAFVQSVALTAGAVTSVFGRAGVVSAQTGDYSFSQISGIASVAQGGTGANLSTTGGTYNVLQQVTTGANVTVGPIKYAATESSSTTWTVLGTTHNMGTSDLNVACYSNSGSVNTLIIPNSVSINTSTFTVTVTWVNAQAGRIVIT